MSTLTTFPGLETLTPWITPVAPFQWRRVKTGATEFEFLFDNLGQQIFQNSSAVWKAVELRDEPAKGEAQR